MITRSRYSSALCGCVLSLTCSGVVFAQARPAPTLPLRNVRLYEAGVGYFERSGKLGKTSDLTLPVPPSHLDDALKTLVVLATDGKTSVSGVEFGSSMSAEMGRALVGLPEASGGDDSVTYPNLLKSLKGASVEVRTDHDTVRGRLVDVVQPSNSDVSECVSDEAPAATKTAAHPAADRAATAPCALQKQITLLVLTDRSEIRRLRTAEVLGIRPTDPAFAARLGSGLDAMSRQGSEAQRKLRVLASSTSDVTLGYVAETPIWRSTYRMVLDPTKDSGILQAWVLIHNDTDEAWQKVRVELVNGRPDSFLSPLAAPRYGRRELVTPKEPLSTVPQLLGKTVDDMARGNMWGDTIGDSFGAGGLGLSGVGEGGGGRGEGIGLGQIGAAGGVSSSSVLSVGDLASVARASGVESGALFRYTLASPVDLRPHGSALVPFLQQSVGARRIAWFPKVGVPARSAARFKNDTQQTLPAGSITFFADGGFAGESTLERMKPEESRILGFGTDLDVELSIASKDEHDDTQMVSFEAGVLVRHFVRHHDIAYDLVNRSGSARTVFLTLDFVRNASVKGADELDFDTSAQRALAVFKIDAKQKATRKISVDEGLARNDPFTSLTSKALRDLVASPRLPEAQKKILRAAAAELLEAEVRRGLVPKRQADAAEVETDILRLRGHVSALQKNSDEAEELVERMLAKEDRLKALRTRVKELGLEIAEHLERARLTLARLVTRPK